MPTAYTADIAKDLTFEQFVWRCARGMGALIMMRDKPLDAPIPEKFEPSDYSLKRLQEAQERLDWLNGLSPAAVAMEAKKANAAALAAHQRYTADKATLQKKYEAMHAKVQAWTPPTRDHQGFKEFMLSQIRDSLKFDCYDTRPGPSPLQPDEWRQREAERALNDVAYHTKAHGEEIDRTTQRNQWVASLRWSLSSTALGINCEPT